MPALRNRLASALVLCAALCTPGSAAESERWYQVELLIFSHEGGTGGEKWPAVPALSYPGNGRFLAGEAQAEALNSAEPVALEGSDEAYPPAFVPLPREQGELFEKAAYMRRTGRYQVLFHQVWAQPVPGADTARPLIIDRSGDSAEWPRLQGSLKLYISRYLHVETNLWLNTQGEYLPQQWQMPAPPQAPASLPDGELATPEEEAYYPSDGAQPAPEQTGPTYPWRHAVLMQQNRRMRSNEVHYLDHPLLGVVIKFTPLSPS